MLTLTLLRVHSEPQQISIAYLLNKFNSLGQFQRSFTYSLVLIPQKDRMAAVCLCNQTVFEDWDAFVGRLLAEHRLNKTTSIPYSSNHSQATFRTCHKHELRVPINESEALREQRASFSGTKQEQESPSKQSCQTWNFVANHLDSFRNAFTFTHLTSRLNYHESLTRNYWHWQHSIDRAAVVVSTNTQL